MHTSGQVNWLAGFRGLRGSQFTLTNDAPTPFPDGTPVTPPADEIFSVAPCWTGQRINSPRTVGAWAARGPRSPRAASALVFSDVDPLARLEVTRVGIGHVLAGLFYEPADTANWG